MIDNYEVLKPLFQIITNAEEGVVNDTPKIEYDMDILTESVIKSEAVSNLVSFLRSSYYIKERHKVYYLNELHFAKRSYWQMKK